MTALPVQQARENVRAFADRFLRDATVRAAAMAEFEARKQAAYLSIDIDLAKELGPGAERDQPERFKRERRKRRARATRLIKSDIHMPSEVVRATKVRRALERHPRPSRS